MRWKERLRRELLWLYSFVLGKTPVRVALMAILLIAIAANLFSITQGLDLFNSIYWAIITITTVGYGDITPSNEIGKIIAMAVAVSGFMTFGALVSIMTNYVVAKTIEEREGLSKVRGARILLVGSSKLCLEVAVSYRRLGGRARIVWLAPPYIPDFLKAEAFSKKIAVVKGNPSDTESYIRAGIDTVKEVVICGRNDSETLTALTALRCLQEDRGVAPKVITVAYTRRGENLMKEMDADVVVTVKVTGKLLLKSLTDPMVAAIASGLAKGNPSLMEIKLVRHVGGLYAEVGHRLIYLGKKDKITARELEEKMNKKMNGKVHVIAKVHELIKIKLLKPDSYIEEGEIALAVYFKE